MKIIELFRDIQDIILCRVPVYDKEYIKKYYPKSKWELTKEVLCKKMYNKILLAIACDIVLSQWWELLKNNKNNSKQDRDKAYDGLYEYIEDLLF